MPRRFFFRLLSSAVPAGDHVPDRELLRRFAREDDTAALELVIRRHADAVWTACRRILHSDTDAEDAFQATFLVLARKAATVRDASVGGWLHRVAVNAALKLRERSARVTIATAEQLNALPTSVSENSDSTLSALVQEELANLPERYRLPVVLYELEGQTHAEAAKVLGWPVGTVASRLSRARVLLRERLARRGVSAPAVVISAAGLPPDIIRGTTAVAVGADPGHPSVSTLTEGVLSMMRTSQRKLIAIAFVSVGLVAVAGFGTYTVLAQPPARPITEPNTVPVPPDGNASATTAPGDSITASSTPIAKGLDNPPPGSAKPPKAVLEKSVEMARKVYEQNWTRIKNGQGRPSELFGWSERWLDAELDLADKPADRTKALRNHLDRTREVEKMAVRYANNGEGRRDDADAATYYRLEAEKRLLKEGVEPHPAKDEKGKPEKR